MGRMRRYFCGNKDGFDRKLRGVILAYSGRRARTTKWRMMRNSTRNRFIKKNENALLETMTTKVASSLRTKTRGYGCGTRGDNFAVKKKP